MRRYLVLWAVVAIALVLLVPVHGPGSGWAAVAEVSCSSAGRSDFNGDGFDDAVVGDPFADGDAGAVTVLYGGPGGVIGSAGGVRLTQDDMPLSGEGAEPFDHFGFSIATGRVNFDGCLDLVIGVPGEDDSAGAVHVVYGAVGGLGTGTVTDGFHQGDAGGERTEAGDQFGFSLAVAPWITVAGNEAAIAIGTPGEDLNGLSDAGVVSLALVADRFSEGVAISQNSTGVPGDAEANDRFGEAVALDALGESAQRWDLIVGTPEEDIGQSQNAGSITVVYDASRPVVLEPSYTALTQTQDSVGVPGVVEAGDRFGHALSALGVGVTHYLAVGTPGEAIGDQSSAGSVQLFTSAVAGLAPGAGFNQNSTGITGVAESGDQFGNSVSLAAPAVTSGDVQLAVGVWQEDIGTVVDAGAVQVFPWTDLDAETSYDQSSPDIATEPQDNDLFGHLVKNVGGTSEGVLLVGVPNENTHIGGIVQVIPYAGTPRIWRPGEGGIPTAGTAFGWALAGQPG